jgi:hypothetical protein
MQREREEEENETRPSNSRALGPFLPSTRARPRLQNPRPMLNEEGKEKKNRWILRVLLDMDLERQEVRGGILGMGTLGRGVRACQTHKGS